MHITITRTPGRGEQLCRVDNVNNIIMFEYLGLAYRNSDYTTVIAIMP